MIPAILWYCFALFFDRLSSSCSEVQSVPRVLLRCFSVGLFIQSEFPCKARCASFLRKTYAIQVFCGDFVIRNFLRIVLFFFFLLRSASFCRNFIAFRIQGSLWRLLRRSGRRFGADVDDAPRSAHTSPSAFFYRFRIKMCPAEIGNGNYRRTDRSTYVRTD